MSVVAQCDGCKKIVPNDQEHTAEWYSIFPCHKPEVSRMSSVGEAEEAMAEYHSKIKHVCSLVCMGLMLVNTEAEVAQ